jgi:hypothetical protein
LSGTVVLREKWPVIGRHEQAVVWLQIWADLGRAPRTIDAYARGLGEYLLMCEREGIDPVAANCAHVAVFVRELTSRPSLRGANVVAIDSGVRAGERHDPAAAISYVESGRRDVIGDLISPVHLRDWREPG